VTPLGAGEEFRPDPHTARRHYVLFVGSVASCKNLERLLEAFRIISRRLPHRLKIVGAPSAALRRFDGLKEVRSQSGSDRIEIAGPIEDHRQLARIYQQADLLIFPSLYESFGLPVLEAMACGTPVVASDIPALAELTGDAAVLVNPYDVEAMAEAMYNVLTDNALRTTLAERGFRRAGHFSWRKCARQTLAICRSVL